MAWRIKDFDFSRGGLRVDVEGRELGRWLGNCVGGLGGGRAGGYIGPASTKTTYP